MELQNHRSLGEVLTVEENRIGGHDEVHPRALNIIQRLNCPLQFAFQRALIGHFFVKLSLAPGHLVKELESHASAVRLALFRSLHAGGVQFIRRNADRLSIGTELMRNILGRELRRQRLCVRGLQILKERLVVGRAEQPRKKREEQHCGSSPAQKECLLCSGATCPKTLRLIGDVCHAWHWESILELHFFYILICADNLVADLHHQLKGNIRFFDCDHHVVQISPAALQETAHLGCCCLVQLVHGLYGVRQDRRKAFSA